MEKEKFYTEIIWRMIDFQTESKKNIDKLNSLMEKFNEDEIEFINEICQFYFKKGVKQGIDFMEYLK